MASTAASPSKPTYISSSGTLTARPLVVRVKDGVTGWWTLFYLFWETLLLVSLPFSSMLYFPAEGVMIANDQHLFFQRPERPTSFQIGRYSAWRRWTRFRR